MLGRTGTQVKLWDLPEVHRTQMILQARARARALARSQGLAAQSPGSPGPRPGRRSSHELESDDSSQVPSLVGRIEIKVVAHGTHWREFAGFSTHEQTAVPFSLVAR